MDESSKLLPFFDQGHDEYALSDIMVTQLEVLCQTLEDELHHHVFLYLPDEEAEMHQNPYKAFPKTVKAFPSAGYDIIGACRCYALGEATASVFHCMGILQYGLYSLAEHLGVTFAVPIQLEKWQKIIESIEAQIKARHQSMPKGEEKDEDLKFYSQAAVQFRYFKDAWRNHVCHMRQQYDSHQALSILIHVTDFMETISTRLKEVQ